jgi:hypothetical protein
MSYAVRSSTGARPGTIGRLGLPGPFGSRTIRRLSQHAYAAIEQFTGSAQDGFSGFRGLFLI